MRHLLLSIIIISLVGILMVPNAFAVKEITVQNAPGSSVPGCEKTDRCFIPSTAKINPGDTVVWTNPDRAVHTVTSGNPTTGPDGYFDSGLMLAGGSYSKTFTSFGTYDYFCMVHPWMEGTVIVREGSYSPPTSKIYSNIILDPLPTTFKAKGSDSRADVTFSGELESADKKFFLSGATITLKFTGFTFDGKKYYEITTDNKGKFNKVFTLLPGTNYGIQAVFDGVIDKTGENWTPSKSQTEYFIVTSSSSQPSTSSLGAPTFLKLDPLPKTFNTDKSPYSRATVTFSGQLMTADKKFYITDEPIKLLFTPSIESWNNNAKRSTDDEGKFNIRIAISQGQNYRIQAIFDGNNQLGPSKSLIQSFSVTPSPSPSPSQPPTSTSSGGFEWAWILIIVSVVAAGAAGVLVKKGLKKTPKATPQRKTFGVKRPRKRRTVGSPVGASSSTDGPSTYGYFECPNCHEPSAPQGKLRQNPDGSQFCSVCGWKS